MRVATSEIENDVVVQEGFVSLVKESYEIKKYVLK